MSDETEFARRKTEMPNRVHGKTEIGVFYASFFYHTGAIVFISTYTQR